MIDSRTYKALCGAAWGRPKKGEEKFPQVRDDVAEASKSTRTLPMNRNHANSGTRSGFESYMVRLWWLPHMVRAPYV
jgi:hypothetical protein